MSFLLRGVEVEGRTTDVRLADGRVAGLGDLVPLRHDTVVEGRHGALLPGLHDHHLHLFALAATEASVDVSGGLEPLRQQAGSGWLRAVGWAMGGDRHDLDAVVSHRPLRVQHRSGALWTVNTAGARLLGLSEVALPGVERDDAGEPTGRLWRMDAWLRTQLGSEVPDLARVGATLARLGITGVTDATPDLDPQSCATLRAGIPQHVLALGDPEGDGPVKVVLPDHDLPAFDDLVCVLAAARPRPVAVHCVTREALLLLLAARDEIGPVSGDRIEHGSVIPQQTIDRLGASVVTQPGFLLDRGDDYLRDVRADDLVDLYRYGSLLRAGVPVVPSSDAPYGPLDPWTVLRAARDRTTRAGRTLGPEERVTVDVALSGMLRPLHDLAGAPRRVHPGVPADVVLLHVPLAEALASPDKDLVRHTWIGGELIA